MPKKQPRNSFYFFMLDFKEQQRKKGIMYANMAEVANAAGPEWSSAPPSVRAKFEAIAKAEKAKTNVPELKFTSTGISLADIEAAERERREAIEAEKRDIINFVKQKSINEGILDEDLYLMDVNSYCKVNDTYLIGELTLLRFTINEGVRDTYHELINPGSIPIGYALDVKIGSKDLGLPMPDSSARRADCAQILANVLDYLRRSQPPAPRARPPPLPALYTLPDKVPQCTDFIHQLCSRTSMDEAMFRIYQLDTLFYQLVAHMPKRQDAGLPKESLALARLKKDVFKYSQGLGCEMHEEGDKAMECSSARVKRWAFTILDLTCLLLGITPKLARHVPADFDIETILTIKDEKRIAHSGGARAGAGRAEGHAPPDDTPASLHSFDSLDTSRNNSTAAGAGSDKSATDMKRTQEPLRKTTTDSARKYSAAAGAGADRSAADVKRTHEPMRMPNINVCTALRAAPELSAQEEFPPLGARGRGRGRGLSSSFDQMRM